MAGGLLPMVGIDSYRDGRGRMLGKLLDTVLVADGQGEPFNVGELTTWLNDAVLMAPSTDTGPDLFRVSRLRLAWTPG